MASLENWVKVVLGICIVAACTVQPLYSPGALPSSNPTATPDPTSEAAAPTVASGPTSTPAELPAWASAFDAYILQRFEQDQIPGLAYALVLPGGTIYAQTLGYRDVENQLPVTSNTLFHIASTQKSMNAMLVASLVDDGYFDWDTPVAEIYPDFALANPDYARLVTFVHLLSMTSGIPDEAEDNLDLENATTADVFAAAAGARLLGAPGAEFSYSNLSSALAGYIAGYTYSGDPDLYQGYVRALTERVLVPIGMPSAIFSGTEARASADFAYSYTGRGQRAESEDQDRDPLAPAGTLKVNVTDMVAYLATQLGQGLAPNGNRVASAANLALTWQPHLDNYALGWDIAEQSGYTVIWHTGAFDNYASLIAFIPELDVGLVILANSEDAAYQLTEEAIFDLLQLILEHGS